MSSVSLSPNAEAVKDDLLAHFSYTSRTGKGRYFKLYDSDLDYANALGMTTDELGDAVTELHANGIAYTIGPGRQPQGKQKYALYRDYALRHARTTSPIEVAPPGARRTPSFPTLPVSTPLSYPPATLGTGPATLPDFQVHPPGRLHRIVLRYQGILDPQATYLLREAADRGEPEGPNNKFGTRLQLSTFQISSKGRLRVFVKDPERLTEALEEFGAFCKDVLHFDLDGVFEGTAKFETSIEVGYGVSGNVQKYASCKVRVEIRGYTVDVSFDKSPGDFELEVRAKGNGPPGPIREITEMIVVNGALATELPRLTAVEVLKMLDERAKLEPDKKMKSA